MSDCQSTGLNVKKCYAQSFFVLINTGKTCSLFSFFWQLVYIDIMNSQNNEDSINFSVIDKPDDSAPALDFSIPELLQQQNPQIKPNKDPPSSLQMSVEQVFSKIKKMNVQSGRSVLKEDDKCNSFLDALERIEKELSFQTESYNIYEQNPNFQTEIIQNNKSKTLSCLKMTKETNKSTNPSAQQQHVSFNDYFGSLIIDFRKKEHHREHNDKEKKQHKSNKSKSKSGSQISIDRSDKIKAKDRINSKSRSKDVLTILGLKEKSKSKPYLLPMDFKKSKNMPNLARRSVSKSQANLKTHTQAQVQAQAEADAYASKVFTEYYGTDVDFKQSLGEMKQKKQQRLALNNIKYSQKSKSKLKLGLFTPKGKVPQTIVKK